ncbi:hypothetical protein QFZ31_005869 [Neobacillus niacini]|uniref:hypothetical protein n=1 Tax=Neobacillus driksii TaxID=3035913 RepID=UPI0027814372|nr:hypothetical protein [Neobacillus niacini]MDQ0975991.1 hypothetical protein [Neobacillus niacini]
MKRFFSLVLVCLLIFVVGCNKEDKAEATKTENRGKEESKKSEAIKASDNIEQTDTTEQIEETQTIEKIPLSEDEKKYLKVFEDAFDNVLLTDSMALLDLIQEAENNSSLYKDENWKNQFTETLAKTATFGDVLKKGDEKNGVPEKFKKLNTLTIEFTELVFMGGVAVMNGATHENEETFSKGVSVLTNDVNDKLDEINAEAERIGKTYQQ